MDGFNRFLIAATAGAWIVLMSTIIFLAWAAPDDTIDRLGDFVEFLADHNTDTGKLIVTLAAASTAILALLVVILEFAPEDEIKELRVEQAGATTIIPADALRMRLEEALRALPGVADARTRVWTRDRGVAARIELVVPPQTNVANLTQEAVRVVVDAVQTDLGLPVSGVPTVKVRFNHDAAPPPQPAAEPAPVARQEPVEPAAAPAHAEEPQPVAEPAPEAQPEAPAHDGAEHHPPRSLDAPHDDRT